MFGQQGRDFGGIVIVKIVFGEGIRVTFDKGNFNQIDTGPGDFFESGRKIIAVIGGGAD